MNEFEQNDSQLKEQQSAALEQIAATGLNAYLVSFLPSYGGVTNSPLTVLAEYYLSEGRVFNFYANSVIVATVPDTNVLSVVKLI